MRSEYDDPPTGRALIGIPFAVALSVLLWTLGYYAVDWLRAHPAVVVKLWAAAALLLLAWGMVEVFARMERRRGRRDTGRVSRHWLRNERRG